MPSPLSRLLHGDAAQSLAATVIGAYLALALRTTRWTLDGEANLARLEASRALIVAFWHDRLPLMAALWQHSQRRGLSLPGCILASRHRDGRLIGALMQRFGLDVVHGSTTAKGRDRGGAAGLRALTDRLGRGGIVILTPDGPRGPARRAAPGIARLAALSGVPIFPAAAQTRYARRLPTWDRMILPLPFGRGVLVCGAPLMVAAGNEAAMLPAIEHALTEVAERADRLCPA